ncbi:hypothetical protein M433DRAFT_532884 [Acidomyces richmondensis BFW]|nr:MAG: hypothetical protein FE78DRAFT_366381 [Acidomyces sp. 'richmondensis']KYG40750.1 hypothetical protein M433DRAFT_532884 [Acidomyces richmondensis BFW]
MSRVLSRACPFLKRSDPITSPVFHSSPRVVRRWRGEGSYVLEKHAKPYLPEDTAVRVSAFNGLTTAKLEFSGVLEVQARWTVQVCGILGSSSRATCSRGVSLRWRITKVNAHTVNLLVWFLLLSKAIDVGCSAASCLRDPAGAISAQLGALFYSSSRSM